jgi:hypothetical protein
MRDERRGMSQLRSFIPALELELLRRGVGDRTRAGLRCADCRRTPLIGEHVHHYEGGKLRCELCRSMRKEQPVTSELVHGPEYGHCVVRITRVAA